MIGKKEALDGSPRLLSILFVLHRTRLKNIRKRDSPQTNNGEKLKERLMGNENSKLFLFKK